MSSSACGVATRSDRAAERDDVRGGRVGRVNAVDFDAQNAASGGALEDYCVAALGHSDADVAGDTDVKTEGRRDGVGVVWRDSDGGVVRLEIGARCDAHQNA